MTTGWPKQSRGPDLYLDPNKPTCYYRSAVSLFSLPHFWPTFLFFFFERKALEADKALCIAPRKVEWLDNNWHLL